MSDIRSTPSAPRPALSRRLLLGLGLTIPLAGAFSVGPFGERRAAAADGFDELRSRWVAYLTGGPDLDTADPAVSAGLVALSSAAAELIDSAADPSDGGDIWSDAPMAGPAEGNISEHYTRLVTIATAWSTVGTDQYQDEALGARLLAWYRHMSADWYNGTITKSGNWWFWEIGIPRRLGDLSALVDGLLDDDDRAAAVAAIVRFTPDPNYRGTTTSLSETGGNRADKALACALRGLIGRSDADMELARDALSDVKGGGAASLFALVTAGNGFYADGSYIDHSFLPYVGTYGNVALAGVSRALMLLAGSAWDVTDPDVSTILDAPERSFAPFIWRGRMMDTVRGRAVSRERERDWHDGFATANSILLLSTQIAEPYRSTYRSLAKAWLSEYRDDYAGAATLSDLSRAIPLLDDDTVEAAAASEGHVGFGAQERMVHRGDGWAYTVSVSSARIGRYEWGNDENNLGWHQGDGQAYLYLDADPSQYADDFWPTVDPYRLPGTTASLAERASGASGAGTGIPRAANAWAGGVGLGGLIGSIGMDLVSSEETVTAKKSWFLLGDRVIAVGSGVSATGADAETIVENRSFPAGSTPRLTVGGAEVGADAEEVTAGWAHLDGVAGYVFVEDHDLRAQVAERSGSWLAVDSGADTSGSADERTRAYATLSVRHPEGTTDGGYAYVVLPGRDARGTRRAARADETDVLHRDAEAHVVRTTLEGTRCTFAHVFGALADGPVTADGPCAVAVTEHRGEVGIAVSDPSRSATTVTIELELARRAGAVVSADPRLSVTARGRTVTVVADLSGSVGASFEAELSC